MATNFSYTDSLKKHVHYFLENIHINFSRHMMQRDQILTTLRAHREELQEKYGVLKIILFGSVARNEATDHSDIDIAVELSSDGKTLHNYLELERYLSELLDAQVDLGFEDTIKPGIRETIESEMIYV